MLLKPVSFLKKAAAASAWDFDDDFSSYATSTDLVLSAEYGICQFSHAGMRMDVMADDTINVYWWGGRTAIIARDDTSLGVNQEGEMDIVAGPGAAPTIPYLALRCDPASNTCYTFHASGSTNIVITKWTASNTSSIVATKNVGTLPSLPYTIGATVTTNGSDVDFEIFIDGVSKATHTELAASSPLTSGNYAGVGHYANGELAAVRPTAIRARAI